MYVYYQQNSNISTEQYDKQPVFIINAILLIPKVGIQPNLDDVQDILIQAGKNISSVAKGVGQWTGGRPPVSLLILVIVGVATKRQYLNDRQFYYFTRH